MIESDTAVLMYLGIMILLCVISWVIYQVFKNWKFMNNTEAIYETAHQIGLKKFLTKRGFDVDKEIMKQEVFKGLNKKRSIRKRLEYEAYKELFGDDKEVPE